MHLALMAYSFANQIADGTTTTPMVIEFTRDLGVAAIELMDEHARDEAQFAAIATALRRTGVAVAAYDFHGNFATADPTERAATIAGAVAACERAARLGAPHVLLIPEAPAPDQPIAAVRQAVADCLRECLPTVRRLGLTASLPNLGELAAYYGELTVVTDLLDAAGPELTLTYDVGNWLLAGENPLIALDRLAPRIAHVHLKDWRIEADRGGSDQRGFRGLDGRRYISVALGAGEVDLDGALQRLIQLGYPGYLAIEYEETDDPTPHLTRSVAWAQQRLAELH